MRNIMDKQFKYLKVIHSESGFALIAAVLACMILMALTLFAIQLSTGDLKTSSVVVGDKMALSAVESGIHNLTQTFEPGANTTGYGLGGSTWRDVSTTNNLGSQFRYTSTAASPMAPLPLAGYSMESGQGWGMSRFNITVEGRNTTYGSTVQVDVGIGYGPVPISTIYK